MLKDPLSVKTVFLSSVARGLEEYREAAYKAIERLSGYHCDRMEDFGAQPEGPAAVCSKRATSCDVFVGIVGQRYGSSPPDDDRSFTEIEYDAARAAGVPRLMFVAPEEFPVPANLIESDEKRDRQQSFRRRVLRDPTAGFFSTSAELAERVVEALHNCRDQLLALNPNATATPGHTYLLFPFVTCSGGWDTRVAISNVGETPFGLRGESGFCTFHYYGSREDGIKPDPQSSSVVRPGETLTYVLSSGGGRSGTRAHLLDNRANGFTGYVVAECLFRYAHGFANITPVGAGLLEPSQHYGYTATTISPEKS